MIDCHRSDRRWITREQLAHFTQAKRDPDPRRAKDACATSPSSNQAGRPDWVLIGLLTLVVFTWAAFAFCIYVIWAKCRGSSPF